MISSILWLFLYMNNYVVGDKEFRIYLVFAVLETILYLTGLYKWGEE